MAENTLNLKQIQDKLLIEYNSQERKIVFWYDDEGDFADDMDNLRLSGVETLKQEQGSASWSVRIRTHIFLSMPLSLSQLLRRTIWRMYFSIAPDSMLTGYHCLYMI